MLSAVKLQVNHLEPFDENEKQLLEKSSKHIDEIVKRFREISYDLLPNTLVRKGLVRAAEEFFNKINDAHEIKIDFNYPSDLVIPKEKEVNIYRIIQEITHNTIKHAKARHLKIKLHKTGTQLILHTKDDGCGFNYDAKLNESSVSVF
jgi:signal transduction histidine kinase